MMSVVRPRDLSLGPSLTFVLVRFKFKRAQSPRDHHKLHENLKKAPISGLPISFSR